MDIFSYQPFNTSNSNATLPIVPLLLALPHAVWTYDLFSDFTLARAIPKLGRKDDTSIILSYSLVVQFIVSLKLTLGDSYLSYYQHATTKPHRFYYTTSGIHGRSDWSLTTWDFSLHQ
jgi:hypothetical protein